MTRLPPETVTGPAGDLTVDPTVVAPRLGLDVATLQREMRRGIVYSRVERGEDADAGNWRLTLIYRGRRLTLLRTAAGEVYEVAPPEPAGPTPASATPCRGGR
jgi:hypothetical protein